MPETRINISELKGEGSDVIKNLITFLKEKTKADVETATDTITVKSKGKNISKKYVRVLMKKFLHQFELRDNFRVIGGEENTLMIKEKKIAEEE